MAKKETTKKKETPKETPEAEASVIEPTPIVSASNLDLKFNKVHLRDLNDLYVGETIEDFTLEGKFYSAKDYLLVMFGNGHMFAVAKAFFAKIAQVIN